MKRVIWIDNKKYYLYDTYSTWNDAIKVAKKYKKKSKYFILKHEHGYLLQYPRYALYFNKIIAL